MLLLTFKLRIGNLILHFLGKNSLEIYLIHGILVTAMLHFLPPEAQPYVFMSLLLGGTLALAWLFHLLFSRIRRAG